MILDSILSFIKNNPLTVTILVMLAVFAPSLFGAALIGLLIAVLLLLIVPLFLLWRMMRKADRIGDQTSSRRGFRGFYTNFDGNPGNSQGYGTNARSRQNPNEGEVKVYTTSEQPHKRVSDSVGDYVEFEEVKEKR